MLHRFCGKYRPWLSIITGSPLAWCLTFVFGYASDEYDDDTFAHRFDDCLASFFVIMTYITFSLYILSRIILIVLAFVELRNIPPGALAPIQWVNILPFIH